MGGTYQIFESSFFSKVSLTILIFRKKNLGPRASAELAILETPKIICLGYVILQLRGSSGHVPPDSVKAGDGVY